MIQDIAPSRLDNQYADHRLSDTDPLLYFDDKGRLLTKIEDGRLFFSTRADQIRMTGADATPVSAPVYLFSVDEQPYFLETATFSVDSGASMDRPVNPESELSNHVTNSLPEGFAYRSIRELRDCSNGKELFAAFTAYHLWHWYQSNRFCGRCGKPLNFDTKERALRCPDCGNVIYPRINPAVIVGVTKGDQLLITRYRTGYGHNALVAGFVEIGETLEETVAREVMEETGIRVTNIRYYKSQPWGMAQDILTGFYCDAVGDDEIRMDAGELKYAEWVQREAIELQPNNLSLTNEMMKMFRDGKI